MNQPRQPVAPVTEPNTVRSADQYYAAQSSAIPQSSVMDSPVPVGGVPTPPFVAPGPGTAEPNTVRSTDQYYADQGRTARPHQAGPTEASLQATHAPAGPIVIAGSPAEVRPVLQQAIQMAAEGYRRIRVALPTHESLSQARQQLDLAITRQALTEAQAAEILFGWTPKSVPAGPPTVEEIRQVPDGGELDILADVEDPREFVEG